MVTEREALRRLPCVWCGAMLVPSDGTWTDADTGSGDYCPEGRALHDGSGTSPHLPAAPELDEERLKRALRRLGYRSLDTDEGYRVEVEMAVAGIAVEYARLRAAAARKPE